MKQWYGHNYQRETSRHPAYHNQYSVYIRPQTLNSIKNVTHFAISDSLRDQIRWLEQSSVGNLLLAHRSSNSEVVSRYISKVVWCTQHANVKGRCSNFELIKSDLFSRVFHLFRLYNLGNTFTTDSLCINYIKELFESVSLIMLSIEHDNKSFAGIFLRKVSQVHDHTFWE